MEDSDEDKSNVTNLEGEISDGGSAPTPKFSMGGKLSTLGSGSVVSTQTVSIRTHP